MNHKYDECIELGHHSPTVNDQLSIEDAIEGYLECRICGAVTEDFSLDWFIVNNEGDFKSISGMLHDEEMRERISIDNDRISVGLN